MNTMRQAAHCHAFSVCHRTAPTDRNNLVRVQHPSPAVSMKPACIRPNAAMSPEIAIKIVAYPLDLPHSNVMNSIMSTA
ncbi:MAG: hypothetical protein AAGB48_11170, partial [Planctomycetota bacterium]